MPLPAGCPHPKHKRDCESAKPMNTSCNLIRCSPAVSIPLAVNHFLNSTDAKKPILIIASQYDSFVFCTVSMWFANSCMYLTRSVGAIFPSLFFPYIHAQSTDLVDGKILYKQATPPVFYSLLPSFKFTLQYDFLDCSTKKYNLFRTYYVWRFKSWHRDHRYHTIRRYRGIECQVT